MSTQTSSRPIFQLRKELSESLTTDISDSNNNELEFSTEKATSFENSTATTYNDTNKILTENEVYTVSRLTTELPSSTKRETQDHQQTTGFL